MSESTVSVSLAGDADDDDADDDGSDEATPQELSPSGSA
jgi:hypothetical protein